jgi:hypothetical protein
MNKQQIIDLQKKIGVEPDGFWGPKSIAASQKHLRRLMPEPNPWPKSDQKSLQAFYGSPGDESKLTNLDVSGLGVKYDGKAVKTIRCHKAVAASLRRVLEKLSVSHPEILVEYAGVYNNRAMRGGSTPSLHARGAAIDLDPDTNGNSTHWPTKATMPFEVMEEFAKEGWLAAGAFWSRDGMHFQATQ